MRTEDELRRGMLPPGSGASFAATKHACLARIEPLTMAAGASLREHVAKQTSWDGDAVIVEMRYFPDLADAIIDAGFAFERDALQS